MPIELRETRLPGIGVKYGLRLDGGGRISLIQHNDGKRELYWFRRPDDDEPTAVIGLDDDEARQLGAVLSGAYERPKIVEELEMALGELQIEWVRVPDTSPLIGKTLAEAALRAQDGDHDHRDPPRARARLRRAAGRRHPAGRHARHGRQGRPVRLVPPPARAGRLRGISRSPRNGLCPFRLSGSG